MKFLGNNEVLCISPHPDDVELSMYGTVLKHKETHFHILCCSLGTQSDAYSTKNRHDEVANFWDSSPAENVSLYFIEDYFHKRLDHEWIDLIEQRYLANCSLICSPSSEDSHHEHRLMASVGLALTRYKPLTLVEYKSPSTLHTWSPNLFVNITDCAEDKIVRLQTIKTQNNKVMFEPEVLSAMHTDYLASKRGIKQVEAFKIITNYI